MSDNNKPCDYADKMKEAKDKQDKAMIHLTNNVYADNDLLVLYLEKYDDENDDENNKEDTTTTDTKREVTDKDDEEGTTTTDTTNIITATRREVSIRFQHGLIKSHHTLSKQIYNALIDIVGKHEQVYKCGFRTCYTCRFYDDKKGNVYETGRFILDLYNFHVELDTRKSTCGKLLGFEPWDDEFTNTKSHLHLLRTSPVQDIRKPLTWMTPYNSKKPRTCTCGADIQENFFLYDYETQEGEFAGEEAADDDDNIDGHWNGLLDDY
ncbi:hypothetical protein EON65_46860 [archaeon]|nr:MAG: hypothetical protein EON65_46860 [archaeon]